MSKAKKREATPSSHKVSPATVDAPPAPTSRQPTRQLRTVENTPKADIPEELTQVEDEKVISAFRDLNPRQQQFLLHYLREWNATEAYRSAYNLLPTDDWAEVNGSQLLRNTKVKAVLMAFQDFRDEDITLIRKTYIAAAKEAIKPIYGKDSNGQPEKIEDLPDHMTRINAAEKLAKLHGANAADKVDHTGQVAVTHKYDIPNKRPVGT